MKSNDEQLTSVVDKNLVSSNVESTGDFYRHFGSDEELNATYGNVIDPLLLQIAKILRQEGKSLVYDPNENLLSTYFNCWENGMDANVYVDIRIVKGKGKTKHAQCVLVNSWVCTDLVDRLGEDFYSMLCLEAFYFARERESGEEVGIEMLPSGDKVVYSYLFDGEDIWSFMTGICTPCIRTTEDLMAFVNAVMCKVNLVEWDWKIFFHQYLRNLYCYSDTASISLKEIGENMGYEEPNSISPFIFEASSTIH